MKRLFLFTISCLLLGACSNSGSNSNSATKGVAFNPNKNADSEMSDAERERKIAEKRANYVSGDAKDFVADAYKFEGKVKLTIFIPENNDLSLTDSRLIESKMIQMATANGIGGMGGNPRFVLAPMMTLLQKDVTTTAPVKYLMKYDLTLYVADLVTGTVFGSYNVQKTGVGESEQRACVNMFGDLNPKDEAIQHFLESSQTKIVEFYKQNGSQFIAEAKMLASQGKFSQAMAILTSIPSLDSLHYAEAIKYSDEIFPKYLEQECSTTLALMKASLGGKSQDGGFNPEAMSYYAMIPNGSCKAEADEVYKEYKATLSEEKKRAWEKEDREWQAKMDQQKADNDFRRLQEELKAKIAISANKCLLDKYKKDAAYDRLPWIRKCIHLGNYDPFDGYKPADGCDNN